MKSRWRRLPQEDDVWEADFRRVADHWVGIVIEREFGFVYAMKMLVATPTVNDLAHILADAMYRPLVEVGWHRPKCIRLRENPEWQDLIPHLEELRIRVDFTDDLSAWDNAIAEYNSPVKDI